MSFTTKKELRSYYNTIKNLHGANLEEYYKSCRVVDQHAFTLKYDQVDGYLKKDLLEYLQDKLITGKHMVIMKMDGEEQHWGIARLPPNKYYLFKENGKPQKWGKKEFREYLRNYVDVMYNPKKVHHITFEFLVIEPQ